jgi:Flp pilus assembly protein TadD
VPYYEEVTRLRPDYAGGYTNLGAALHWLGDWDEAETAWKKSLELEPTSVAYQNMGTLYYYLHRFEEAAEFNRKALEISTSDHRAWGRLAAALRYVQGQEAASQEAYFKAIELVEERLTVNPDDVEDLSYLAAYSANAGEMDAARETIAKALMLAPQDGPANYFSAIVQIHLGNAEASIEHLEKAVQFGYSLRLVESDPQFAEIREFAKFRALVARTDVAQ